MSGLPLVPHRYRCTSAALPAPRGFGYSSAAWFLAARGRSDDMAFGLLLAVIAAVCTAAATMLQAVGARHARHFHDFDPRLLLAVIRSGAYVAGLALLTLSFVLTLGALRSTPLFVVQAISAASLAAVAAMSALMYRTRLEATEWVATVAVVAGVVLLVITERSSRAPSVPAIAGWALLGAAVAIAALAFAGCRVLQGAALPSLLAGLAFGDAAVGSRIIARGGLSLLELLTEPAGYAIMISGLVGTLLYATALQRGSVTSVFAVSTVAQTLGPAVTGWLLLGDGVRHGELLAAAIGFAVTLGGAIVLGRHAQPHSRHPHAIPRWLSHRTHLHAPTRDASAQSAPNLAAAAPATTVPAAQPPATRPRSVQTQSAVKRLAPTLAQPVRPPLRLVARARAGQPGA
jgi:drug/metabolite transporter (DMT)-like permease